MPYYPFVAFISGLVVLAVEITSFRILAPYFGNSIFITTNVLGVILAGLATGYWIGGRLADRTSSQKVLYQVMVLASLIIALIPFVAPAVLAVLREQITGLDWTLILTSLGGSLVLFYIPFVFLGMVSPWLVRLSSKEITQTGRSSGSIFAWSTVGSLIGTFLPSLLMVPLIGTKRTILVFAAILALTAAWGLMKKGWAVPGAVLIAVPFFINPLYFSEDSDIIAERESAVEYLKVVKDSETRVHLEQDEGFATHSVYDSEKIKVNMPFDWFALAPSLMNKREESLKVAYVGLGAGTSARQFAHWFGPGGPDERDLELTGVELDAETIELAREYFGLSDLPLPIDVTAGDGRVWMEQTDQIFDVVIMDAYRQLYIPPHMSSREFFESVSAHMSENGVMVLNLNVVGEDPVIHNKMAGTIASVFPSTIAVDIPNYYGVYFFASKSRLEPSKIARQNRILELEEEASYLSENTYEIEVPKDPWFIATDDRPLVESLFDAMLAKVFLSGGDF